MKLLKFAGVLVVVGLMTVGGTGAQEKGKSEKSKGYIRPGWGKLDLTAKQKQDIYNVQTKYKAKIEELEKQIKDAKEAQYKDEVAVLTPAQRQKLKDAIDGDKDTDKKSDKKGEKKPG